jgi:hypothetical protein
MIYKAYKLDYNLSRFPEGGIQPYGDGYRKHEFEGWDQIKPAFFDAAPIIVGGNKGELVIGRRGEDKDTWVVEARMPKNIVIASLKNYLSFTDYPYIIQLYAWPIMSKKMLEVLLSVGDFPHQVIPVTFTRVEHILDKETGRSKKSLVRNHDYIILQLLELSHVLDMDKSIYKLEQGVADPEVTIIRDVKLKVLKEPDGGFPPIFRIKGDSILFHVSAVAKQALEDAGIQGIDFDTFQLETP